MFIKFVTEEVVIPNNHPSSSNKNFAIMADFIIIICNYELAHTLRKVICHVRLGMHIKGVMLDVLIILPHFHKNRFFFKL